MPTNVNIASLPGFYAEWNCLTGSNFTTASGWVSSWKASRTALGVGAVYWAQTASINQPRLDSGAIDRVHFDPVYDEHFFFSSGSSSASFKPSIRAHQSSRGSDPLDYYRGFSYVAVMMLDHTPPAANMGIAGLNHVSGANGQSVLVSSGSAAMPDGYSFTVGAGYGFMSASGASRVQDTDLASPVSGTQWFAVGCRVYPSTSSGQTKLYVRELVARKNASDPVSYFSDTVIVPTVSGSGLGQLGGTWFSGSVSQMSGSITAFAVWDRDRTFSDDDLENAAYTMLKTYGGAL